MKKILLVLIMVLFLTSVVMVGCEGGIAQEVYDRVAAELSNAQAEITDTQEKIAEAENKITEAENKINDLQEEKEAVEDEYQTAQAKIDELMAYIDVLREQQELVGETKAETAEKIVKNYHDTHVYSTYDLFVCSDMAAEVWNMLKAQGIDSVMVVGNIDKAIGDILQSNHAWVLAEVAPGDYLALEATGGYVVPESENPLYYRGWSFDSPSDIKSYHQLVNEYNVRVGILNELAAEDREVVKEHNQATDPQTAGELEAVHDKLVELIKAQENELYEIEFQINGLSTKCGT
jgi:predicted nuclease with TOPRIM domain